MDSVRLDALWDFADPAGSAARFRSELHAELGAGERAELTTQLARAHGLQGEFDRAAALLDSLGELIGIAQVRLELERGRLHHSAGRPPAAIEHFLLAYGLAIELPDDFLAVDAAHMLAIADRDQAEKWTRVGLGLVARTSDTRTRRWAGSLRNNFGWTLHDRGDFVGALHQFEAAQEAYTANGTAEQVHIARWAVARALRSLGRLPEALQIQLDLLADDAEDGYVSEELAELLAALGRADEAHTHRQRAAVLLAPPEPPGQPS